MIKYKSINKNYLENILSKAPKFLDHLQDVAKYYEGFIFGIQGVLLEESQVFPNGVYCLEKLRLAGKTVALMSNVSQLSSTVIDVLTAKGISLSLYQHIITSGDEAYRHLLDKIDPWHNALGDICFFIGRLEDARLMEKLPYHYTSRLEEADFILAASLDDWDKNVECYFPVLNKGLSLHLPLVCTNPDLFYYKEHEKITCAGSLAAYYQEKGGEVFYHGKPYIPIFNQIFKRLSFISRDKILLIGDSLVNDILGANRVDLDSLLVLSDTTVDQLKLSSNTQQTLSLKSIFEMIKPDDLKPTYMMQSLKW
jgi:HAD superfamily hydrolase (TIGR01459 family)